MTSNMIYIVALGAGLKCPHKIHLNTQSPGGTPSYKKCHVHCTHTILEVQRPAVSSFPRCIDL